MLMRPVQQENAELGMVALIADGQLGGALLSVEPADGLAFDKFHGRYFPV